MQRSAIAVQGMFVLLAFAGMTFADDKAPMPYDPLALPSDHVTKLVDFDFDDPERDRKLSVRVYLPKNTEPSPVVVFSHGLGGSRHGNAYLGKHWSARGYVVVFLQHPGSDTQVWMKVPFRDRTKAMREAANGKNLALRVGDVKAALDQLERWNKEEGHGLFGRLDLSRIGMSGHSFGAVTTQAVSGQEMPVIGKQWNDDRIKAAIAMSPSSPRQGSAKRWLSDVKIPWLLMTGTKDTSILVDTDIESRLAVYEALPPADKYELVLHNGEHSAFNDRPLPGDREDRNPNHHRVILALSTAFWDAHLRDDKVAKEWLTGDGPKSVLESEDRWQRK